MYTYVCQKKSQIASGYSRLFALIYLNFGEKMISAESPVFSFKIGPSTPKTKTPRLQGTWQSDAL